jgi:UDP-N-acetylglucosamine 2-epimerase
LATTVDDVSIIRILYGHREGAPIVKILHVVGNRPQFIKLAPFLKATQAQRLIDNVIVHSGQHYDYTMSRIFFEELGIPDVKYNLEVGSGTHGFQTGGILTKLDPILSSEKPDVVVVYGDTNTTLAGALAAYKFNIPVAHVESGMREYIWRPEEINKKLADHCSNYCFCPLLRASENLKREGIPENRIYFTGDITYDAFSQSMPLADEKGNISVPQEDYILMTMHRAETVDIYEKVKGIIAATIEIPIRIILPLHPRTRAMLKQFNLYSDLQTAKNVTVIDPVGYFEFLKLMKHSRIVVTDSSGVLKEAFYAEKLCVTVDDTTEYREIFDMSYNVLAGTEKTVIVEEIAKMLGRQFTELDPSQNPFGNGHSADGMVSVLIAKK